MRLEVGGHILNTDLIVDFHKDEKYENSWDIFYVPQCGTEVRCITYNTKKERDKDFERLRKILVDKKR